MVKKTNSLWTEPEEIYLVIILFLAIVVFIPYPNTNNFPALFNRPPDFFRIDINQATREELDLLPDIGPVRARKIVEYRISHGKFKNHNDLKQVPGITDKIIHKMGDKITF